MTNTWGVLLDGYQSQFIREVAGSVKEKADIEVGESQRYQNRKAEYLKEVEKAGSKSAAVINLFNKGLTEREISLSGFVSRWYARHVLAKHGLLGVSK